MSPEACIGSGDTKCIKGRARRHRVPLSRHRGPCGNLPGSPVDNGTSTRIAVV
ncbi:hypothetical protein IE4803_PB00451 (plasmid) [Rhizobium etli bv. phaseoli str. IE4803]|nr:hypothetical protein IE4803_PB00451 [Rhizobium etli bv. phaseoli str. IE4803]